MRCSYDNSARHSYSQNWKEPLACSKSKLVRIWLGCTNVSVSRSNYTRVVSTNNCGVWFSK